ncbi:MAG: endonuclease/exonuclease/phosphatase family protein [Elusimicrobiota bacterium]|nr:MAG: endonuclease/exonuclease/phosphatase family protein [Elusimicrobiota bacterium]
MAPLKILVLTLNTAALPLVHPAVTERVAAQAEAIAAGGYDVVGLQEVWLKRDENVFRRKAGLAHAYAGSSGFPVSAGLMILSRWPFAQTEERVFSVLRPSWLKISNGEPLARKGVLRARVATPGGPLDVYASHLLSNYGEGTSYMGLRTAELFELAEFVLERSSTTPYVILADLNAGRGTRDFDLFMDLLGARDACRKGDAELCGDRRRGGERIDFVLLPPGAPHAVARSLRRPHSREDSAAALVRP